MGLDIDIDTDIKNIYGGDYANPEHDYFHKHNLSREFCNFMCQQHAPTGEPELDQIGRFTQVDISPLYQMDTYRHPDDEWYKDDLEKQLKLEEIRKNNERLQGNIDKVYLTINSLIENLSTIDNLHQLLNYNNYSRLRHNRVFCRLQY